MWKQVIWEDPHGQVIKQLLSAVFSQDEPSEDNSSVIQRAGLHSKLVAEMCIINHGIRGLLAWTMYKWRGHGVLCCHSRELLRSGSVWGCLDLSKASLRAVWGYEKEAVGMDTPGFYQNQGMSTMESWTREGLPVHQIAELQRQDCPSCVEPRRFHHKLQMLAMELQIGCFSAGFSHDLIFLQGEGLLCHYMLEVCSFFFFFFLQK